MKKSAETTAKWRENERKKDPEVFKARQQFWASRMFKSYTIQQSKSPDPNSHFEDHYKYTMTIIDTTEMEIIKVILN